VEPIPRLAAALILVALAAGCARTHKAPPTAAPAPTVSPPVARALPPEPRVLQIGKQTGKASWYGDAHHGRKTASGETFDMNALTAAHRTLPLGTWVRVTNTRNGRSVEVRINDRGPYGGHGRIIDVSEAAAHQLDMIDAGVVPVVVEILPGGPR